MDEASSLAVTVLSIVVGVGVPRERVPLLVIQGPREKPADEGPEMVVSVPSSTLDSDCTKELTVVTSGTEPPTVGVSWSVVVTCSDVFPIPLPSAVGEINEMDEMVLSSVVVGTCTVFSSVVVGTWTQDDFLGASVSVSVNTTEVLLVGT